MPLVELVDETYVAADVTVLAALVHDEAQWTIWWPDLQLTPFMDRGDAGIRWSAASTRWSGSVELWLEAVGDGVLVHHYQRLDPVAAGARWTARAVARERDRRARAWKVSVLAVKDELEGARRPGTPVPPYGSRTGSDLPTLGG